MRLSFVAKVVIFDNSFFDPAGERRGPVFKAELATGSDRRFGLGGEFGVALTACMRNLLLILNSMLKHHTRWGPPNMQSTSLLV